MAITEMMVIVSAIDKVVVEFEGIINTSEAW
jgi:hypothetical protein